MMAKPGMEVEKSDQKQSKVSIAQVLLHNAARIKLYHIQRKRFCCIYQKGTDRDSNIREHNHRPLTKSNQYKKLCHKLIRIPTIGVCTWRFNWFSLPQSQ
jgi:hypothetical protein